MNSLFFFVFFSKVITMRKLLSMALLMVFTIGFGQNHPQFWNDVQKFKVLDKEHGIKENSILFLGSSSFTMWQDAENYFPGKSITNRAFGGSSLKDLNFYNEDLLKPYHPSQIVIYCGENDFSANPDLKAKEVFSRFETFYNHIKTYHPETPIAYVSIKMSPSREHLWKQFEGTNKLIKKFMEKKKETYIDITESMLDENGKVRHDIFLEDMLHMKPSGYELWSKVMAPYLK